MTTLEVIYENGIFKPLSSVPLTIKEHDRVRIIIETDTDENLRTEINQWETASDENWQSFEKSLEERLQMARGDILLVSFQLC